MMQSHGYLDPAARMAEKERSRAADEAALAEGLISREELSKENGFFSSLVIVESSIGEQDFHF